MLEANGDLKIASIINRSNLTEVGRGSVIHSSGGESFNER